MKQFYSLFGSLIFLSFANDSFAKDIYKCSCGRVETRMVGISSKERIHVTVNGENERNAEKNALGTLLRQDPERCESSKKEPCNFSDTQRCQEEAGKVKVSCSEDLVKNIIEPNFKISYSKCIKNGREQGIQAKTEGNSDQIESIHLNVVSISYGDEIIPLYYLEQTSRFVYYDLKERKVDSREVNSANKGEFPNNWIAKNGRHGLFYFSRKGDNKRYHQFQPNWCDEIKKELYKSGN